jgi:hypothetical protein
MDARFASPGLIDRAFLSSKKALDDRGLGLKFTPFGVKSRTSQLIHVAEQRVDASLDPQMPGEL